MVNMRILGLSVDSTAKTPILLLQEEGNMRILPIWIGSMEAMSISLALSGQSVPRPLTHDLLLSMLSHLQGSIESIEIINFVKGTFYADVVIRSGDTVHRIDCRPSDGITLAIKLALPIYVHPEVLENALHAEQKQDAASFQTDKPEEDVNSMLRQQMLMKELFQAEEQNSTGRESRLVLDKNTGKMVQKKPWSPPQEEGSAKSIVIEGKIRIPKKSVDETKEAEENTKVTLPTRQRPRVQHITITPQPKAQVKTLLDASSLQEGDKDVEALLRAMEPPSSKPM